MKWHGHDAEFYENRTTQSKVTSIWRRHTHTQKYKATPSHYDAYFASVAPSSEIRMVVMMVLHTYTSLVTWCSHRVCWESFRNFTCTQGSDDTI